MTEVLSNRLAALQAHLTLLARTRRGIEKEGLRVDPQGGLALTPHPQALGAALTHARITTDYSESLLELITGTHTDVDALLEELTEIHRYVAQTLQDELVWNHSMPARLPPEPDIPIGWYGTSNTGMLKHVYRRGLAERYGKTMQCIAGLHYNFSLDDALWEQLELPGATAQERRSAGYIALIRNFTRYSWLLMYLFGASPAISRGLLAQADAQLQPLDAHTLYLPYATSLRMSDLGYQNKAQSKLKLGYNDLRSFLSRLYEAVTQPWPAYERIGTHRDGQWIQLNANLLQIENEYYSSIRPKRSTGRCERPITALAARGVQYVEVRCLDIDPYSPIGISAQTARFMDAFLLHCALEDSPLFPEDGHCNESPQNFARVVREGRRPGLTLSRGGAQVPLADWGRELLAGIGASAALLDRAYGTQAYGQAVAAQAGKLDDPQATPSARILAQLREQGQSFHAVTLAASQAHAQALRAEPLPAARLAAYREMAEQSLREQAALEAGDTIGFDEYVARYHAALENPSKGPCTASG
ncbi:glutamate--cysteine ligase [Orrella sp. JC864]|uniref:glutamate--cysteine ligase n=1 Tax=Orrella sp. JC864 TaxID=3120298 RepID=UPI00300A2F6E